jgi:hypothetical protein
MHPDVRQPVLEWDVDAVSSWISQLGLGQYAGGFEENNISGDVLVYLDHSDLSDIGVQSVGHRLRILKATYQLIVHDDIKLDGDYYVPPTALEQAAPLPYSLSTNEGKPAVEGWTSIVHSFQVRDERMGYAEAEIRKLMEGYARLREDLLPIFRVAKESKPLPTPDAPGSSVAPNSHHSQSSPTLSTSYASSPTTSPPHYTTQFSTSTTPSAVGKKVVPKPSLGGLSTTSTRSPTGTDWHETQHAKITRKASLNSVLTSSSALSTPITAGPLSAGSSSSEPFKSFRVTMDDPCYKVLPAALRKYKINGDPRQYALLVCYGDQERLLGMDEKPLIIFKELQDAGKRPVFMLRHIEGKSSPGGVVVGGTPGGVL